MSSMITTPPATQSACLKRYSSPISSVLARAERHENTITAPSASSVATQHNRIPLVRFMIQSLRT